MESLTALPRRTILREARPSSATRLAGVTLRAAVPAAVFLWDDETVAGGEGLQRCDVRFRGHVQGVGFRYTAEALARTWPVTGYVQNLPNGDVQLVVEGRAADISGLLEAIAQRMASYIEETRVSRETATGGFAGFQILLGP